MSPEHQAAHWPEVQFKETDGLWFCAVWETLEKVSPDAKEFARPFGNGMAIGIELKIKIIIMKKYSLIVTCLGLFIAGCSKNDDTMTTGRGSSSTSQYGSGSSGSKDTSITDTNINSTSRRARSGSLPSEVTTGIDTNANTLSTPSTPESSSPPLPSPGNTPQIDTNETSSAQPTTPPPQPSTDTSK